MFVAVLSIRPGYIQARGIIAALCTDEKPSTVGDDAGYGVHQNRLRRHCVPREDQNRRPAMRTRAGDGTFTCTVFYWYLETKRYQNNCYC